MKIHHAEHIVKGSLGHQHLIFYFVSVSTSIWSKVTEVLISRKDYLNPNNLVEGDLGKTKVVNFYFLK